MLALQVIEDFPGDFRLRVDDVFGALLDDETQPVFAGIEHSRQCLQVCSLEDLFRLIAFQRPRTHGQLGIQVGNDLAEKLLEDFG